MDKGQLEMLHDGIKALEDYQRMHDVDSPTFDLGLALIKKAADAGSTGTSAG